MLLPKIPASRQLMPLAFAAGIGGIITMVGTPPNIIVSGTLTKFGEQPFGFFEFCLDRYSFDYRYYRIHDAHW